MVLGKKCLISRVYSESVRHDLDGGRVGHGVFGLGLMT